MKEDRLPDECSKRRRPWTINTSTHTLMTLRQSLRSLISGILLGLTFLSQSRANPVEIGAVNWQRDFKTACAQSRESGKPIFLLFQEVPGCQGCQAFGKNILTLPLLVEAIEDEFIPVVAYNNKPGTADDTLRIRYGEPAWNYQVIRFLDAEGRDIIPRKDRVWDAGGLLDRMIQVLEKSERSIPKYLQALRAEYNPGAQATAAFSMFCFWTGEKELGQIDGVIRTEAGWFDGQEVTRVVYDQTILPLSRLASAAADVQCARKVYIPEGNPSLGKLPVGRLTKDYRPAKASDQKKQIGNWTALRKVRHLTSMQLTKINAFAPVDPDQALSWLSPRQRKEYDAAR
jgi:hypothetical protein